MKSSSAPGARLWNKTNSEVLSHLAKGLVPENDREHFLKIAKEEIAALHERNFARYRLRPAEFRDWQKRKT
jgi:hypothetical protein